MLSAAIFDMDGLLFDTERLCCDAWRAVSAEAGYRMDDEVFFACVGRNNRDTRAIVMESCGPEFPYDEFNAKARAWLRERMERDGPPEKPGIRKLFDYLALKRVPIALATSTSEANARWMIERSGLTRYFSGWAFGNEVERGKPEPDIFLLALSRLGVTDRASCVVFEDSPAGLQAALSAGMKPVFIRDLIQPEIGIMARIWKESPSLGDAASDLFFQGV